MHLFTVYQLSASILAWIVSRGCYGRFYFHILNWTIEREEGGRGAVVSRGRKKKRLTKRERKEG